MPDIYSIMMQLNLDDKASEGLHSVTEGLTKLVEQLDLAKQGFTGLQTAIAFGAGVGIVAGMMKISGAANELTKGLNQMRLAGMDAQRALDAINMTVALRPGVSMEDARKRLAMLLPQIGPAAYGYLPEFTRQEEAFRFAGVQGGVEPAIQAARERGMTDPARIQQFVEEYLRIAQSTLGAVTPQMLAGIMRRGGAAAQQWSPEFLEVGLPSFLLSGAGLGGRQNIGMALERLDQAMLAPGGIGGRGGLGGALNRRAFQQIVGRPVMPQDEQMMAQDPARWARTVGSQLEAAYGEGHMADVIKRLFTNPVVQQAMLFWMTTVGAQAMERQQAAFRQTLGSTPAGMAIIDKDPSVMLESIRTRWQNLMDQIALANQPEYLKELTWIDSLAESMQHLQKQAGPEGTRIIIAAFEGIGGAIATLAAVYGLSFLIPPAGAVVLAVAGIALVISTLVGLNWDAVKTGLEKLSLAIRNFMIDKGWLKEEQQGPTGIGTSKMPWLKAWPNALMSPDVDPIQGRWPRPGELGVRQQPVVPPTQVPSWLPQFLPQGDPHKGKDVNVSVDLNLDGRLVGNVLISKVLDDYEFAHGPPSTNPNTAWPGNSYTPQSQ